MHGAVCTRERACKVGRYDAKTGGRGGDRMPGADVNSGHIEKVNLVVDEILVVIAVPEIAVFIFVIVRKTSLDAHGRRGLALAAIMPQMQCF